MEGKEEREEREENLKLYWIWVEYGLLYCV